MKDYHECHLCGKHTKDLVIAYVNGTEKLICWRCFIASVLHETIKDMLVNGSEEDLKHVVRVLEGINDLIEENPYAQAIRWVIDEWAHKYPKPLFLSELESKWRYRFNLYKIINYLISEGILTKTLLSGSNQIALSPSDLLRKLLQKFPSSKGFFTDVIKAITGLAIVRYLVDPENIKFRSIYATLQAIVTCIEEDIREPVYEVKGYRCRLCDKAFSSRTEIKSHILSEHPFEMEDSEESLTNSVEVISGRKLGEWCKYAYFIEKAGVYGIKNLNAYIRRLLTRGALITREGDEVVMEHKGVRYLAVDESWIRVRERMRMLERQLVKRR